jgi:hypothetical protein
LEVSLKKKNESRILFVRILFGGRVAGFDHFSVFVEFLLELHRFVGSPFTMSVNSNNEFCCLSTSYASSHASPCRCVDDSCLEVLPPSPTQDYYGLCNDFGVPLSHQSNNSSDFPRTPGWWIFEPVSPHPLSPPFPSTPQPYDNMHYEDVPSSQFSSPNYVPTPSSYVPSPACPSTVSTSPSTVSSTYSSSAAFHRSDEDEEIFDWIVGSKFDPEDDMMLLLSSGLSRENVQDYISVKFGKEVYQSN